MFEEITPDYIKSIRAKYGLSQQAFARLLGLGEASVARYEKGQTPSKANANLIRAAADPKFMRDCLTRDGSDLSPNQRDKTEKILYAMLTFGEKGEIMDINEIYEITLTQEILTEQAAQQLGEVARLRQAAREAGDEILSVVYDDAFRQLARVKSQIIREENSNLVKLSEIKGKLDCLRDLVHTRTMKAA